MRNSSHLPTSWNRPCAAPFRRAGGQIGDSRHRIGGFLTSTFNDSAATKKPVGATTGDKVARLEAALFLATEPLSSRRLAELADLADGTEARTLIRELEKRLCDRPSAFQPVEVAGGVQLRTRAELAPWLTRIVGHPEEVVLSGPALETLAVVAYKQPVGRADIEAIRGVQCGEILRVLMQRDLLRIVGRSEELGRPFLYGTTRSFLQTFGLRKLDQLPRIDETFSQSPPVDDGVPTGNEPQLVVGESVEE